MWCVFSAGRLRRRYQLLPFVRLRLGVMWDRKGRGGGRAREGKKREGRGEEASYWGVENRYWDEDRFKHGHGRDIVGRLRGGCEEGIPRSPEQGVSREDGAASATRLNASDSAVCWLSRY
ncbi:hypothetical protein N7G274_002104 [Stereocaulon virgatum]|uniref:Uncharacterized protein n=1 Tax=Stereocaulon virgatum TaxID=373712 RepID=A0ABR4AIS5_9LECA